MTQDEAITLIEKEYWDDDGLLIKFRMSDDVEIERLECFIVALEGMTAYYADKSHVSKSHAYMIMSFRSTLSASARHWKVSRPEGLSLQMTTKLIIALSGVFATASPGGN